MKSEFLACKRQDREPPPRERAFRSVILLNWLLSYYESDVGNCGVKLWMLNVCRFLLYISSYWKINYILLPYPLKILILIQIGSSLHSSVISFN